MNILIPMFFQSQHPGHLLRILIEKFAGYAILLSLFIFLIAEILVNLLFPGFDGATSETASLLVRIIVLSVPSIVVCAILSAYYYSRNDNVRVELSVLIGNLSCVAFAYFFIPVIGISAAAVGILLRYSVPLLGLWKRPTRNANKSASSEECNAVMRRLAPLLISSAYFKSEILIDRIISSLAAPGAMTLFGIAHQINIAGAVVFNKSVTNQYARRITALSALSANGSSLSKTHLAAALSIASFAYLTFVIALLDQGSRFAIVLGDSSALTIDEANLFISLTILMSGIFLWGMVGQLFAAHFYIRGKTRALGVISSLGFTMGIALKLGGFYLHGVKGLAIATSAYYMLNCLLLLAVLTTTSGKTETRDQMTPQ